MKELKVLRKFTDLNWGEKLQILQILSNPQFRQKPISQKESDYSVELMSNGIVKITNLYDLLTNFRIHNEWEIIINTGNVIQFLFLTEKLLQFKAIEFS